MAAFDEFDPVQVYVVTYPGEPYSEVLRDWDQVLERVGASGGHAEHVPLSRGLLLTCSPTDPHAEEPEPNHVARKALGELTDVGLPTFGVLAISADSGYGTPAPLTAELRRTVLDAVQIGAVLARTRPTGR